MLKLGRQIGNKIRILLPFKLKFSQCAETKVVELKVGKVKGKHNLGVTGHEFYSFEGIPYGKPPVGDRRFLPAEPADPWKELDCLDEPDLPVQWDRDTRELFGNEDCLYLNVYTKHFDTTQAPLPVILYFHGGGFRSNGASRDKYGPDYLMREDIVYVIFSYRLCSLGFLMMDSPELGVHGNAGVHDQLMALRWVNKHIAQFNGDPKNITIMGTSAGAASVHFMMCLPQACGLFQRVIMMSGTMMSPWCQVPNMTELPCRLAAAKGYKGDMTDAEILKFLQSLPAEELVQHHLFGPKERVMGHMYPFVPGVEAAGLGEKGLLARPFLDMMRDAWAKDVPLLLGGTTDEGQVMYPYVKADNGLLMDVVREDPALLLPYELYTCLPFQERAEKTGKLINFHFGPRTISKSDVYQILELLGYKLFWHAIHRLIMSRLAFANAPTYLYCFDFDSPTANLMRIGLCGDDIRTGVCHADELGYMFPRLRGLAKPLGEAENCTIERMVGILTAFARNGDPNCAETQDLNWPPVCDKDPYIAMNIGRKLEVRQVLEKDGIKLWNELYNNDTALLYGI